MKRLSIAGIMAVLLSLSSCKLVGDIFKAGVWVGILVVVVVIVIIVALLGKMFGGK